MSVASDCEKIGIPVYGAPEKGSKITEAAHMTTFFARVRREKPLIGKIATHIRNEGKRSFSQYSSQSAQGMVKGAADIVIPGAPTFVCEIKSLSTESKISKEQLEYLRLSKENGCFACVALGVDAAWEAFEEWAKSQTL